MKPTSEIFENAEFRKSLVCGDVDGCVEIAKADGYYGVRDSKNPTGPVLVFDQGEWDAFVKGVHNNEF